MQVNGQAAAALQEGEAVAASAAQQPGEEALLRSRLGVGGAAVGGADVLHDLVDVLAAAGPGDLAAGAAGSGSAHGALLR